MAEISFEHKNYYDGEISNQMRHGFGVYIYSNKYFRYEGDWVKGKKHGKCFTVSAVFVTVE